MSVTIKFRRGSSSAWTSNGNIILASGEPGYELDTGRFKIGNGITIWNNLPYAAIVPTGFLAGSGISINLATNGAYATINASGATISNYGNNRVLTSDGTSTGINGETNLTFDGSLLNISGNLIANTGSLDRLVFDTSLEDPDLSTGQLQWNSTEGTLDLGLTDNYTMHLGEEMLYRVRNVTGFTLRAGQPVYASGLSPGGNNRIEVNLYAANGTIREVRFMGLMTSDLTDNGNNGYATHFGYIRKVDTNGGIAADYSNKLWVSGEPDWAEGDILYVHPTVPGKLTKIEPKHSVSVAIVTKKANNGKLFVRPTSYGHLDDNHDVDLTGASNGQFLQYNLSTDYWIPSSSGNFTTLQVNGTEVSLSGHSHTPDNIIGLTWKGPWQEFTEYNSGDVVYRIFNNINSDDTPSLLHSLFYVCTDAATSETPGETAAWTPIIPHIGSESGLIVVTGPSGILTVASGINASLINDFNSGVSGLLPSVTGSGYIVSTFNNNIYNIAVTGLQPSGNYALSDHTHTSSQITDFNESVDDRVGSLIVAGTGISRVYNDAANTLTISISGLINNPTNDRILTSRNSSTTGIDAETNLVFDGTRLGVNTFSPSGSIHVIGSGLISSITGLTPNAVLSLYSATSGNTVFNVAGSNGNLFTVTNNLTGVLFSVNNDLGLPVFQVSSDYSIKAGRFNQNDWVVSSGGNIGIGTGIPFYKLDVIGTGNFTENILVNGTGVSISGHTHSISDITNFNSSVSGLVSGIYAPLISPALTGIPTAPTATSGTNTTQIATTAFVRTEVSNLVASAPSTLDTLNELASALGNDPNFATTVTNNLSTKVAGTGTINYVPKFTSSQTIQNSIIVDDGTNVGIGTSSPNNLLHVAGNSTFGRVSISSGVGSLSGVDNIISTAQIDFYPLNTRTLSLNSTALIVRDTKQLNFRDPNARMRNPTGNTGDLEIFASNSISISGSPVTIDKDVSIINGKIGIGTTSPSGKLHVVGSGLFSSTTGVETNALLNIYSNITGHTVFNVEGTNGSLFSVVDNLSGSLMSVNNNAGLPIFEVFSDDSIVGGRFGQNDWIVSSGGNIGIGTGIPGFKLHVIGTGNFVGDLLINGTGVSASGHTHTSSDIINFSSDISGLLPDVTGTGYVVSNFSNNIYTISITGLQPSGNYQTALTNPITGTGIANHIAYWNSSSGITADNNQLYWDAINDRLGIGTASPSYILDVVGTGNFSNNILVNGTGVSLSGHKHTTSDITNFNNSVSGLLPTINNSGDNRILTSTGAAVGINAESNLTFDGSVLNISSNSTSSSPMTITANSLNAGVAGLNIVGSSADIVLNQNTAGFNTITFSVANSGAIAIGRNNTNNFYISRNFGAGWQDDSFVLNRINGNIGIGTSNPSSKLHVIGSGIFASGLNIDNQIANTIASFDSNKNIVSLSTSTYPSLTELSYVKGVTSAIQTQLNAKQNTLTNPVTGTGASNHIAYWTSSSTIAHDANQLYWDSTNNIMGIGKSTPSGGIHIYNNGGQWSSNNYGATIVLDGFRNNGIALLDGNSSNPIAVVNNAGTFKVAHMPALNNSTTAPTERLTINSDGTVGIGGSNTFGNKVFIYGSANSGLSVNDGTNTVYLGGDGTRVYTGTPNAAPFAINTNALERMRIDDLGNVRIGSTSTSESFGKFGVVNGNGYLYACNSAFSTLTLGPRKQNDGFSTIQIYPTGVLGAGGQKFWIWDYSHTSANLSYYDGNTAQSIMAFGAWGLGGLNLSRQNTSNEGGELRFARASDNNIAWIVDVFGTGNAPKLRVYDTISSTERLTITASGTVGINNANPSSSYKLDVNGSANFSEDILINGTSVRNKSLSFFTALDNQPPATNFATLDTRNSIAVLDFDDTTEEGAVFVGVIPNNAILTSGLSVRIHWMATTATSGNCRWGVQFEKMTSDLDSDSFDTAAEDHSTTNATAGIPTTTTITCTSIDSLVAGDFFRIKIYRDTSDTTNDTMTGDAELIAVEIRSIA